MSLVPYYGADQSSSGGLCRQKCDSQPNPQACCAIKSRMPSCNDADCRWGTYVGGNNMAWNPNTNTVTYQNTPWPSMGFNPVDPRPYIYTIEPTPGPMPMPGSSCASWGPCSTSHNPRMCCAKKPKGCDTWCGMYGYGSAGDYTGYYHTPTYTPQHRDYNPYDFTPYSANQFGFDQSMYNQYTTAPYTQPLTPAPTPWIPNPNLPVYQQPLNPYDQYWNMQNHRRTRNGSNDKLYGVDKGFYGEFGT